MSDTSRSPAAAERLRSDLAALGAAGAAALLVAADGRRVLWATPAGADLVGGVSAADLAGTDLNPDRLPVARFAELAAGAAPAQGQRLERLRVINGRRVETVTFSCRRVQLDAQEPLLLLVVPGPRRLPRSAADQAPFPALLDPPPEQAPAATPAPAAGVAAVETVALPAGPAQPTTESLKAAAGGRPLLRFVWQTDGEGRFAAAVPALETLVGSAWAIHAGESWADLFARGIRDEGLVGAALDAAATFTNIDVLWPVGDGSQAVPVALSGVPDQVRNGVNRGMRGFGLVRIEGLVVRERPADPSLAEQTAAPSEPIDEPEAAVPDDVAAPSTVSDLADVAAADAAHVADVLAPDSHVEVVELSASQETVDEVPLTAEPSQEVSQDRADHAPTVEETPAVPVADQPVIAPSESEDLPEEPVAEAGEEESAARAGEQPPAPDSLEAGSEVEPEVDVEWRDPETPSGAEAPVPPRDSLRPRDGSVVQFTQVRGSARATLVDTKVVPIRGGASVRSDVPDDGRSGLSRSERHAFREIARALGARLEGEGEDSVSAPPDPAAKTGGPQTPPVPVLPAPASSSTPDVTGEEPAGAPKTSPDQVPAPVQQVVEASEAEHEPAPHHDVPAAAQLSAPSLSDLAKHADTIFDRLPVGVLVSRGDVPIVMNRTLLDLLGWDDIESFHADGGMQRLFRGRGTPSLIGAEGGTVALSTRDGDIIGVDARLQTVPWDDLPATLMTFRRAVDVEFGPKLKAAELDLRRREGEVRELRAMLDTATDGVIVLDEAGRILSINRSAEALFGYDQNEVAGETFISLFAPDSHATALDYLEGLKSNGVASVLNDGREVAGRVRQGGRIPLFMTLGAISDPPDRKFCAVLRDITPWKKAETDLLEAKRAAEEASAQKSDFLAKMSHEIRTPLSAIIGFAEVMMEERFGPVGNERYLEYLRDIHASGGHVISLVNDLLDLSKIEAGRFDLAFVSVDVNESVARSVALIQPQAGSGRVVVRTALAQRLPRVVADERSLRQIVLNLLSNAVKFTDPGGQVIVSTAMTDRGEVAIRVRDTGIGMTEKEIETALEPFRQVATARRAGGTGLGLPLTKALVEANRAALTIRSARDSGTLVEVLFPTTRVLAE